MCSSLHIGTIPKVAVQTRSGGLVKSQEDQRGKAWAEVEDILGRDRDKWADVREAELIVLDH